MKGCFHAIKKLPFPRFYHPEGFLLKILAVDLAVDSSQEKCIAMPRATTGGIKAQSFAREKASLTNEELNLVRPRRSGRFQGGLKLPSLERIEKKIAEIGLGSLWRTGD
ncbi:hypothetical protein AVEN_24931-1 [Araneus ventricosus]|uniref:Uncharacterized protein n=1 Tax=Araneus ventricosus TaxID=182803 RepID=A0A4Y2P7C6_ARAVE|nr:hypothetical protein AVEN_24931-1 [Araneus ventricosus]